MKKKLLLLTFIFSFLFTVCAISSAHSDNPSNAHRIMSFNIRYGSANDGENSWTNRKELLFEVIKEYNPDILGVQEALDFQINALATKFAHFKRSGVGRDDGSHAGEHSAIFYDSTKFSIIREETFWFSETPQKAGSMSWGAHFPRICSWAELVDNEGKRIFVFNNHWDHESQVSRKNSAQMLINKIKELKIPAHIIVMGDFNAGENNPAFRILIDDAFVKLKDTFRALKPAAKETGTFNGFDGVSTGEKIDAILVSATFKIINADILHTNRNGTYPSDHFPVTAELLTK